MNFKATLILIIILSIVIPVSILFLQNEPELMPENIKWLKIKLLDDEKRLITEVIEP